VDEISINIVYHLADDNLHYLKLPKR